MDPIEGIEDLLNLEEDIPHVTRTHKDIINLPLMLRDFQTALKEVNNNKSPGSNGITPEFYLAFLEVLQHQFYASTMYSMEQGVLTQEQ